MTFVREMERALRRSGYKLEQGEHDLEVVGHQWEPHHELVLVDGYILKVVCGECQAHVGHGEPHAGGCIHYGRDR